MSTISLAKQKDIANSLAALRDAMLNSDSIDHSWIQPMSSSNGWTLSIDTLKFLVSLMAHLKPRHILEFGSGLSTRVMERACSELLLKCCITSVDHDPDYGEDAAQKYAVQQEQGCRISFQLAPLVARDCGGKMLPTYYLQPERFSSHYPVDLVIIDGPPVMLGGREGILYQAIEFSRSGTIILLDDAKRQEEQTAITRWQDAFGESIEVSMLPGFFKGLAVIIVHKPITRADIWSRRLCLTAKEIAELIPHRDSFVLVGEPWLRS